MDRQAELGDLAVIAGDGAVGDVDPQVGLQPQPLQRAARLQQPLDQTQELLALGRDAFLIVFVQEQDGVGIGDPGFSKARRI